MVVRLSLVLLSVLTFSLTRAVEQTQPSSSSSSSSSSSPSFSSHDRKSTKRSHDDASLLDLIDDFWFYDKRLRRSFSLTDIAHSSSSPNGPSMSESYATYQLEPHWLPRPPLIPIHHRHRSPHHSIITSRTKSTKRSDNENVVFGKGYYLKMIVKGLDKEEAYGVVSNDWECAEKFFTPDHLIRGGWSACRVNVWVSQDVSECRKNESVEMECVNLKREKVMRQQEDLLAQLWDGFRNARFLEERAMYMRRARYVKQFFDDKIQKLCHNE